MTAKPLTLAALAALVATAAIAQDTPDYGDDSSLWANDGVCDDPRFAGPGVAETAAPADAMADATDCRAAVEAGTARLAAEAPADDPEIAFGDDTSTWANDGECDDPRFEGSAMASMLLDEDRGRDATDCRSAYLAGAIDLREGEDGTLASAAAPPAADGPTLAFMGIELGDDSSEWANDRECDDRRFTGDGMASTLEWANTGRDATDCLQGLQSGRISLWVEAEALAATNCEVIDFGSDSGDFTEDGKCDDPRFEGRGTDEIMSTDDLRGDATDCARMCAYGLIGLRDYRSF